MKFDRRKFLECSCKTMSYLTMASALRRFGLMNAYAQTVSDYKALVCIFLFGGNDGNNLIIPTDANGTPHTHYTNVRTSTSPVGLTAANLQTMHVTAANADPIYGSDFSFHPTMPAVKSMFESGRIAVLANAGPLIAPTTRAQYIARTQPVPSNLFSHSDQQNQSQTSAPNSLSVVGWGGRIADFMQSANAGAQYPTLVSTAGSAIFTTGNQAQPVNLVPQALQPNGTLGPVPTASCAVGTSSSSSAATAGDCTNRTNAMQQLLTFDTGAALVQEASSIMTRSFLYTELLNDARLNQTGFGVTWPTTNLANQLHQVAEIIQVRNALGMKRQIFFVSIGGFDTHSSQGAATGLQPNLLTDLNNAMNAFNSTMNELGVQNDVTTFTLSDFGRTLQPNTGLGTDHAWGSHHLIMGGAVQGQRIFGQFPLLQLAGANDAGSNGRWIPTTSIDQYGATLAKWFGVNDADLPAIFPNLNNFTTKNLGFLG